MADLSGADLSGANLSGANLIAASLTGTNFDRATFSFTAIGNCDLSEAIGLNSAIHDGPSSIGVDTVFKSQGRIPDQFLRAAGVPEIFITFAKSLVAKLFEFYSCFISYSSKDTDFADQLQVHMRAKGVRCWFFPEDAKWG